jgi:hypothetical protein
MFSYGGSNEFGGLRGVLYRTAVAPGAYHQIPENNSRTYELKSIKTGQVYSVTMPWVSRTDVACFDKAKTLIDQIKTGSVPESFSEPEPPNKQKHSMFVHPNSDVDEQWWGKVSDRVPLVVKNTEEDIVKYTIYLSSFVPASADQMPLGH